MLLSGNDPIAYDEYRIILDNSEPFYNAVVDYTKAPDEESAFEAMQWCYELAHIILCKMECSNISPFDLVMHRAIEDSIEDILWII